MYKKANYNSYTHGPEPVVDATTAQLQSLGMRIRKAVSDGYSVPSMEGYLTDYERQYQQMQMQQQQQRVPLPSHLANPPSLSYGASSTLEGESFNEKFMAQPVQVAGAVRGKRSRDDDEDARTDGYADRVAGNQVNNKDVPIEYFQSKYGSLSFNEEF